MSSGESESIINTRRGVEVYKKTIGYQSLGPSPSLEGGFIEPYEKPLCMRNQHTEEQPARCNQTRGHMHDFEVRIHLEMVHYLSTMVGVGGISALCLKLGSYPLQNSQFFTQTPVNQSISHHFVGLSGALFCILFVMQVQNSQTHPLHTSWWAWYRESGKLLILRHFLQSKSNLFCNFESEYRYRKQSQRKLHNAGFRKKTPLWTLSTVSCGCSLIQRTQIRKFEYWNICFSTAAGLPTSMNGLLMGCLLLPGIALCQIVLGTNTWGTGCVGSWDVRINMYWAVNYIWR